jgi:hypothetical protein
VKKPIIALLALLFLLSGCGQQAQPVQKTNYEKQQEKPKPRMEAIISDDSRTLYLDNQTININKDKTIASFCMKVELTDKGKEEQHFKKDNISHFYSFEEILIGNRKMRHSEIVLYSKDKIVRSTKNPNPGEWTNIIPQTNGEEIYNAVMKKLKDSGTIK